MKINEHHRSPNPDEVLMAIDELNKTRNAAYKALRETIKELEACLDRLEGVRE